MSTPTALQTLSVDATDAAWRTAGSQFVKLTRDPLVALLHRHLGADDESLRGRIAEFLNTELGEAIVSAVLSAGLSAMPLPKGHVGERLSRELRVRSLAGVGDAAADVLMGPLRDVAATYLSGQPVGIVIARDPAVAQLMEQLDCTPEMARKIIALQRAHAEVPVP